MPEILLSTLNAKFIHAAFGLRYLLANLGDIQAHAALAEFDINQKPTDIAEAILARNPRIVGLGIYIWNVTPSTELVSILKRIRPDLIIIVGGPEVSYETGQQEIVRLVDHVITGEADLKFAEVCRQLLSPALSDERAVLPKIISAELPDLAKLALPYGLYDDRDVAHRVVYVEASRGCPFTCEFCLSSLDVPVRATPLEPFLAAMQHLLERGVRQFKFVDRTFNLNLVTSRAILEFFLARWQPGLFVHFEMVPDRLPEPLREIIARFPPGALQFEVGIQSFDPEVGRLISRRQNFDRLEENFHWLRAHSGVHVHADLIAGLPGENLASFAAGFDRLHGLKPQEIQVGILKRLRGTPIIRHDVAWAMKYSPYPPYEILENRLLDFATLARLRRFAKFWDIYGNSGNFKETLPCLWTAAPIIEPVGTRLDQPGLTDGQNSIQTLVPERSTSPFWSILAFSDWLHAQGVKTSGIALTRQYELLWEYLTSSRTLSPEVVAHCLEQDYRRPGRSELPECLRRHRSVPAQLVAPTNRSLPKRQARHVATVAGVPSPGSEGTARASDIPQPPRSPAHHREA